MNARNDTASELVGEKNKPIRRRHTLKAKGLKIRITPQRLCNGYNPDAMRRSDLWVGLAIFVVVQLVFAQAWRAGLVGDWSGLAQRIEQGHGAADILHSFGFQANQQIRYAFLYLFFSLCEAQPLCWHLLFTFLHAVNGYLFYRVLRLLFRRLAIHRPGLLLAGGVLLFLFNPYQSEPVVYKACFNWLLSSSFVLMGLMGFLQWQAGGRPGPLVLLYSSFALGLFVMEQVVIFPLYVLILYLGLPGREAKFRPATVFRVFGPLVLLLGAYLILNKFTLGGWVGHYGEARHLRFDPALQWGTVLKYLSKIFGLTRYTAAHKGAHYEFFEAPIVQGVALGLALAALLWSAIFWKRLPGLLRVGLLLFLLGGAALLPVSNLYFYHLLLVTNDRYSYLAAGFLLAGLVSLLGLLPASVRWLPIAALLTAHLYLMWYTLGLWREQAKIYYTLMESFPVQEERPIYLLNLPDNYLGIFLFQHTQAAHGLVDPLVYVLEKQPKASIREVINYNMVTPWDGVRVGPSADSTLTVRFNQPGNWWWRKGRGGGPYETNSYRWEPGQSSYQLHLKDSMPKDAVFLYVDSLQWRYADWHPPFTAQD